MMAVRPRHRRTRHPFFQRGCLARADEKTLDARADEIAAAPLWPRGCRLGRLRLFDHLA